MNQSARTGVCGAFLAASALFVAAHPSAAQTSNTPPAAASANAPPAADANTGTCVERIPAGKDRPKFIERFPERGTSGHAVVLEVAVEHGKGETVLPTGFRILSDSPEAKALNQTGFHLPDPNGPSKPRLKRTDQEDRVKTIAEISFVPLPEKPGRQQLILPPVPITISRASGELVTVCTKPHAVTIEDPIANLPNPVPKQNPEPRPQREEWTTLKYIVYTSLVALVVGAIVAWLIGRWLKRPRKAPPPPPPRPPWDTALEALYDIRHAGLMKEGRFSEHFDRVSDVMRKYLGERFGFDGLESTTRETLWYLRQVTPFIPILPQIEIFLREADLVKFARRTPAEQECEEALARAEDIVRRTVPDPVQGPAQAVMPGATPTSQDSAPPPGGMA
jgi:hypothetical protein